MTPNVQPKLAERWVNHLEVLSTLGYKSGPRGLQTRESCAMQFFVADSRSNLLDVPTRNINVRFAVAEWLWMMFGHSDVESIAQYNSVIRKFSDDGRSFTGAYGPHIGAQQIRALAKLITDPETRQAVIQVPRPQCETKDEPCTLSWQFLNRNGFLNCIATMRSSDAWLGLPYDFFNFSQLQNCYAGKLGLRRGWIMMQLGSGHLYETNFDDARRVLAGHAFHPELTRQIHTADLPGMPPQWLDDVLMKRSMDLVPKDADDRWRIYAQVLCAPDNRTARALLIGHAETF